MSCTLKIFNGPFEGFASSINEGYARIGNIADSLLPLEFDDSLPEGAFFEIYILKKRVFLKRNNGRLKIFMWNDNSFKDVTEGWKEMEKRIIVFFGHTLIIIQIPYSLLLDGGTNL